ncbi:MAG TPA: hypothetical protein VHI71_07395 [Actinomycetota bacterium]|nr:hypothetical protein [Actinomycetota bacterium]
MDKARVLRAVIAVGDRVDAVGGRAAKWWQRWWIWVITLPLAGWCFIVMALTWKYAGQPVAEVSDLFSQMQMLITATQAVIAFAVGIAVMYSSKTAADAVRQTRQRDLDEAHRACIGRALAFTGAAVEVAFHGGMFATAQRSGLKRRLTSPRVEEEVRLMAWKDLSAASSAAAKALQHLRYVDDDFLDSAEDLFALIGEIVQDASAGEIEAVESKAALVASGARDLETMIKQLDPRRSQPA